ncbi:MAG: cytochrome c [Hyphomonadaceae bacterium]
MANGKRSMRVWAAAALVLGVAQVGQASAQSAVPASPATEAVKARQANFKAMGGAFKTLNDELKAANPDAAKLKAAAATVKQYAAALPNWFPAGSGPSSGVKTAAKAEIWSDAKGCAAAAANFQAAANKLSTTADKGDVAAIAADAMATGKTCGGCHTPYRVKN